MSRKKRQVRYGEFRVWSRARCKGRRHSNEEEGLFGLIDPEEEEGLAEPIDPEEEEGLAEPIDPEEEEGLAEPIDPNDVDGFPAPIDRSGRRRPRRRLRNAPLCGDYPPARPGNVRRSSKPTFNGKIVVRLAPHLAEASGDSLEDLGLPDLEHVLDQYDLKWRSRRLVAWRGSAKAGEAWVPEPVVDEGSDDAKTYVSPPAPFSPEPRPVDPGDIVRLECTVANGPLAPLHSLATYWRLDANHKPGLLKKILKRLNTLAEVSLAYPEVAAFDPSNGADDPFAGAQTYLDRAPFGIDARWAARHGGDGRNVKLVDLEQGWMPDHPELSNTFLIHGNNRDGKEDYVGHHGTAVLGEIIAEDNDSGVLGIAPRVQRIGLASHYHDESDDVSRAQVPGSDSHVAEAIYAAISPRYDADGNEIEEAFLRPGDVLLIEVQRSYMPTEIDPADFDAIRLASSRGVIVVEAAGNGGRDLDRYKDTRGAIFNRRSGGYRESGAIMVGAALGALPHNRKHASNYGSRVDCFAWGSGVVSTGYGDLHVGGGTNETYTADFSNTSAAAPIIAGAAICLQSMYKAKTGGRHLSPGQMRALLADPATGTLQGRRVRGHIGVMPNLRAIAENTLRVVPDVYARDRLGDTGFVPAARTCQCPDVLVSLDALKIEEAQERWGEPEGPETKPEPAVGFMKANTPCQIYARLRNRGLGDAKNMVATVYCGPAATLLTPDRWTEIGRSDRFMVPQGDTLAVSGPIPWSPDKDGFYCLVALVEEARVKKDAEGSEREQPEPTRLPPGLVAAEGDLARCKPERGRLDRLRVAIKAEPPAFSWGAYLAFMRRHNHVAVRNLHAVDSTQALDFLIAGTPAADRGRFFDLEVLQRLPTGTGISLDIPQTLAPAMSRSATWVPSPGRPGFKRYRLPPLPAVPFCRIPLAAGAEHGCRFVLHGGVKPGHSVAIRQLYRGLEVGRVTFQFQ